MKIRKDINLRKLEEYGYRYKENLFYPTYQKNKTFGNKCIPIEIFVFNRTIYIQKSPRITEANKKFIDDLLKDHMTE